MKPDHYNFCMFCGYSIDKIDMLAVTPETSICSHCARKVLKMEEEENIKERMEKWLRSEFFNQYGSDL